MLWYKYMYVWHECAYRGISGAEKVKYILYKGVFGM